YLVVELQVERALELALVRADVLDVVVDPWGHGDPPALVRPFLDLGMEVPRVVRRRFGRRLLHLRLARRGVGRGGQSAGATHDGGERAGAEAKSEKGVAEPCVLHRCALLWASCYVLGAIY